jgi:hypothetical protein
MLSTVIGVIVGVIVAIPFTIIPINKFLRPRNEKKFYSLTLIPIAMIYIGFSYYYGNLTALHAEIVGVIIFTVLALLAQFMSSWILVVAYLGHGMWDIFHEIFVKGISDGIPWTQVPQGYAAFCLAYDVIIAVYVYKRLKTWSIDNKV